MNKLSRWILTKVEKFSEMLITKTELIPRIQQIMLDHDLVKEINDPLNDVGLVGLVGGFFVNYESLKQKTCECIESFTPHVHIIDGRRYMFTDELENSGNKIAKSMAVVAKMFGCAYITYNMFASEGIKFDAIVMDTSMQELGENVYEFLKWHEIAHLELDHHNTETVNGIVLSMANEYSADRYALKHTSISIKEFTRMQHEVLLPVKGKNTLSKDELKTLHNYTQLCALPRVANIILCKLGL